jgi:predicted NBD/HSP70 family sugar kinase
MEKVEIRSLSSGVNQQGLRDHNERLILSTLQRLGPMPGSDLARRAGLSPQTVSVILRRLEKDGFLKRGNPNRGKVGKPSIPMGLDPDGVFSIGLKIGRRTADMVLTDFLGHVRAERQMTYRYPMPGAIVGFLRQGLAAFSATLGPTLVSRIAGIGIGKPFEIWNWHDTIGAPVEDMAQWKSFDLAAEIAAFTDLPVFMQNDATAACRAEHIYGRGREFRDFAYFFVGSFIGGGIVLNHSVFEGLRGNAGAFGSLPIRTASGKDGQLIDAASLYLLEDRVARSGLEPLVLWTQPLDWSAFQPLVDDWITETAHHLARAVLTVCAVVDFEAVLIEGAFPDVVRATLIAQTRAALDGLDSRGILLPRIEHGIVGQNARAIGAATAPVFAKYLLNTHGGIAVPAV